MIRKIKQILLSQQLDFLFRIAILLTLAASLWFAFKAREIQVRQEQLARCQLSYNITNNRISSLRNTIAQADRDAVDNMIKTVTNAKSRDVVRNALTTYIKTRENNDRLRDAHPVPIISDFCG